MAGLQKFLGVRNGSNAPQQSSSTPPPSTQPTATQYAVKSGRADASALKVKPGETSLFAQPHTRKTTTTALPAYNRSFDLNHSTNVSDDQYYKMSQYDTARYSAHQIKVSDSQTAPLEKIPHHGDLFDDTITTDFELTKSDIQAHEEPTRDEYQIQNQMYMDNHHSPRREERERYNQRQSRSHARGYSGHVKQLALDAHKHRNNESPFGDAGSAQKPSTRAGSSHPGSQISGRFGGGQQKQQDLAIRNSPGLGNVAGYPDEQSLSEEHEAGSDDGGLSDDQQDVREHIHDDENDDIEDANDQDLSPLQLDSNGRHFESKDADYGTELPSEGGQSSISTVSRRQARDDAIQAQTQANVRVKLDYTDEQLERMHYADLKKEAWDVKETKDDKDAPRIQKPEGNKRPIPTLSQESPEMVTAAVELAISDAVQLAKNDQNPEPQANIFASLTMEEYEEAGDMFIEKFGDLMKKIREVRKKRRQVAARFENELEAREKAVRGKSDILEQKLKDMRSGGESVLKGKV